MRFCVMPQRGEPRREKTVIIGVRWASRAVYRKQTYAKLKGNGLKKAQTQQSLRFSIMRTDTD